MAAIHPTLTSEPPHNLTVDLDVIPDTPLSGYFTTPLVALRSVIEPWASRLEDGWLNLTDRAPSGAETTTVLAEGTGPEVVDALASLPEALGYGATVWGGQHVYVFGGDRLTGRVLRYTPATDTWTVMNATFGAPLKWPSAVRGRCPSP